MGDRLGIRSVVDLFGQELKLARVCFFVNRTCGGNFSDTFSHTTHHRLITEQCHQNCFGVNRNCGGNFSDTFFSHHRSCQSEQCHPDYNGENSQDRKDAQCRETEQCHQLRETAKKSF
jgi:hypothetical protein